MKPLICALQRICTTHITIAHAMDAVDFKVLVATQLSTSRYLSPPSVDAAKVVQAPGAPVARSYVAELTMLLVHFGISEQGCHVPALVFLVGESELRWSREVAPSRLLHQW